MTTSRKSDTWLWSSLVVPSSFVLLKYSTWYVLLAYAISVFVVVFVAPRIQPFRRRIASYLVAATIVSVVIVFMVVYPMANTHNAGQGSDDDDANNAGAIALMTGQNPYGHTTYLGNPLHQLPGSFVLSSPFVLLGTSALQNLFWLLMFFVTVRMETQDTSGTLLLAWVVLLLSPTVAHQLVTGTGHLANAISVLLGLWWLTKTRHRGVAAVAWGVALASRANFLFLLPLAFAWFHQHNGWRVAVWVTGLAVVVVAGLTLPFYLYDPDNFGPLEAADRLTRFDTLVPHLGVLLTALMAALATGLSLTRMDTARLFRNCALVQAFPVFTGLVLSIVQDGTPDLGYAAYGTFFAWFGLAAVVVSGEGLGLVLGDAGRAATG